jgi:hypothetical protein
LQKNTQITEDVIEIIQQLSKSLVFSKKQRYISLPSEEGKRITNTQAANKVIFSINVVIFENDAVFDVLKIKYSVDKYCCLLRTRSWPSERLRRLSGNSNPVNQFIHRFVSRLFYYALPVPRICEFCVPTYFYETKLLLIYFFVHISTAATFEISFDSKKE